MRFADSGGGSGNNPLYDFDDINKYQDNIFNGEPDFKDVNSNELFIGDVSDAKANADLSAAGQVPFDLFGVNRITSPDIGAYQHIIFEE